MTLDKFSDIVFLATKKGSFFCGITYLYQYSKKCGSFCNSRIFYDSNICISR